MKNETRLVVNEIPPVRLGQKGITAAALGNPLG
jgi:hypothetical protein